MRCNRYITFLLGLFVCGVAYAGFLHPTAFPKTVSDLSFVDRLALKRAGYEAFESVYDENGYCISGCAYSELRLEDELEAMERRNALARQDLMENYGYAQNDDGSVVPPETPVALEPLVGSVNVPSGCSEYHSGFNRHDIPYGNPLGQITCITSPYGPRVLEGQTKVHYGIDFRAVVDTPVYAPADGRVVVVFVMNKTCGNGVVIEHSNGYSTKYCHFNTVSVSKNDWVSAGCLIGFSGNTGHSTGPHLHYAVLKDNKPIDPINFIEPGHARCN